MKTDNTSKKIILSENNVDLDWLEEQLKCIPFLADSAVDLAATLINLSATELEVEYGKIRRVGHMLVKFPRSTLTLNEVVTFAKGLDANEMEAVARNNSILLWWD